MRKVQSGYHDIHHAAVGTLRWCAGWPAGHWWLRWSGAGDGLPGAHGPARRTRDFAFHLVAADRAWRSARILQAGAGGLARRDFVRGRDAIRRIRREPDRSPHAIPKLEGIFWLLPRAVRISALEKGANRGPCRRRRSGECRWLRLGGWEEASAFSRLPAFAKMPTPQIGRAHV